MLNIYCSGEAVYSVVALVGSVKFKKLLIMWTVMRIRDLYPMFRIRFFSSSGSPIKDFGSRIPDVTTRKGGEKKY
jgi:hypothetical protein